MRQNVVQAFPNDELHIDPKGGLGTDNCVTTDQISFFFVRPACEVALLPLVQLVLVKTFFRDKHLCRYGIRSGIPSNYAVSSISRVKSLMFNVKDPPQILTVSEPIST